MTKITIRALVRDDLPSVSHILDETSLFRSDMLNDMVEPYLTQTAPHIWLAACTNDHVVGFAYCEPERITESTFNLLAIAVLPDRQRTGTGKLIVAAIEKAVRELDGRVLLVETSSLDEYANTRSFYDGLDFRREAVIRDYYTEGEDKVVFWKKL